MRRFFAIVLLLFLCAHSFSKPVPTNPQPRGVRASSMGFKNVIFVEPGDNLQEKYDQLISNTQWGPLASDNPRTLILTPGTHAGPLVVDTNDSYITIKSLTSESDTMVVSDTNTLTLKSKVHHIEGIHWATTAANKHAVYLCNEHRGSGATVVGTSLTAPNIGKHIASKWNRAGGLSVIRDRCDEIQLWGGDVNAGWYNIMGANDSNINEIILETAPGNSIGNVFFAVCPQQSIYRHNKFTNLWAEIKGSNISHNHSPVLSAGHFGGSWYFNDGGPYSYRVENPPGTFAGNLDNGKDANNVGDNIVGIPITGHNIPDRAIISFGGTSNYGTTYYVIDSIEANWVNINAVYNAETFSGTDTYSFWASDFRPNMFFNSGGEGSYGGDRGSWIYGFHAFNIGGDVSYGGCNFTGMNIGGQLYFIQCGCKSYAQGKIYAGTGYFCKGIYSVFGGSSSALQPGKVTGYLEGCTAEYKNPFSAIPPGLYFEDSFGLGVSSGSYAKANLSGNTGTIKNCKITVPAGQYDATYPTGASIYNIFSGNVSGCHPDEPTSIIENNIKISQFDNGHTYNNDGAAQGVTTTANLPPAFLNGSYTFADVNDTANTDFAFNPDDGDYIRLNDGTEMSLGEYLVSDADAYAEVTFKCRDANCWTIVEYVGTLTQENP